MKKLEVPVAAALGAAAMWMVAHVFGMGSGWSLMLALCTATGTAFLSYRPMEVWETLSSEYAKARSQFSAWSKKLRAYMTFVLISEGQKEFFKRRYEDLISLARIFGYVSGAALLLVSFCFGGYWLACLFELFGFNVDSSSIFLYELGVVILMSGLAIGFNWLCERFDIKTQLVVEGLTTTESPDTPQLAKKHSTGKRWAVLQIYLCLCAAAIVWPLLSTAAVGYFSYVFLMVAFEASRLLCVVILNTLIAYASFERTSAVGGAVLGGGTSIFIFGSSSSMSLLASMALGGTFGYGILRFRLWRAKKSKDGDPYFTFFNA